jgi:uncharacterized membrane protein (UPF0182 family)
LILDEKHAEGKIMETDTQMGTQTVSVSNKRLWAGRIISGLAVAFLLFDSVLKLLRVAPVLDACARLGVPQNLVVGIGAILLVSVVAYAIPRTAILGAILLTGYLGGAVFTQLRAGGPLFDTLFPIIFGMLIWAGIFLRDSRLHAGSIAKVERDLSMLLPIRVSARPWLREYRQHRRLHSLKPAHTEPFK